MTSEAKQPVRCKGLRLCSEAKQPIYMALAVPLLFVALFLCGCEPESPPQPNVRVVDESIPPRVLPELLEARYRELLREPDLSDPEYLPEIVQYLEEYAPDFLEAEEVSWGTHSMCRLAAGKTHMEYAPLAWLDECFWLAYTGNPRGMVCMAEVMNSTGELEFERKRLFRGREAPMELLSDDYWMNWAIRYMGEGWAWSRRGEMLQGDDIQLHYYMKAMEIGYPEVSYNRMLDLDEAIKNGSFWARGYVAFRAAALEDHEKSYGYTTAQSREFALHSGYACTEKGAQAMRRAYAGGGLGFPKSELLRGAWAHVWWGAENWAVREYDDTRASQYLSPEDRRLAMKNGDLVTGQCERQREKIRQKERPRWAGLTRELQKELEPFAAAMRARISPHSYYDVIEVRP